MKIVSFSSSIAVAAKLVKEKPKLPSPDEQQTLALFDEFRLPLLRYLRSLGLAAVDAEEVVQEVFLALFQHLQAGKNRENLSGWLFRVAHNIGLKRRKKNSDLNRRMIANPHGFLEKQLHPSDDPEQDLANNRRQQRLLSVVRALPERERNCLFLRAEGLNYREIAKVLDVSVGTVSQSLARSIGRLTAADLK